MVSSTEIIFGQVDEQDIYNFLNQVIDINNVKVLSKKAKPLDIENPYQHEFIEWCINTGDDRIELSQIDSIFISKQINRYSELKWDKKKIYKKIRIKRKSIDYFSIPLFLNEKKDLIIIYHSQYSRPLAYEGKYELYKKVNDKWELINLQLTSVS